jgi:hypothetical protein
MIKSNLLPCTDWVQKLAARNLDDLSISERSALNEHLALCRACNEVHTAYQTLEKSFLNLLSSKPAPVFSLQLPRLESKAVPKLEPSLQNLITLLLSAFSSLFMKISWSQLYQKLHTWVLIALAHFPRQIAYVSSNSHYSYAIRSDSGFILWQQKRYNGHNLVSTVPIRWNGISYAGAGIAYVGALDFCKYAVQA